MKISRRFFLSSGIVTALSKKLLGDNQKKPRPESPQTTQKHPEVGCLVDTTLCIGCLKCEEACQKQNNLKQAQSPMNAYARLNQFRRPDINRFTVVQETAGPPSRDQQNVSSTFTKIQCMHCLTPACVSACVVGAMTRQSDGSVIYKPEICLGCRYCMVACPFEIPAYEYGDPITPRVRKCEFCADVKKKEGANPACAAACPTEALVFGERDSLLKLAKDRIKKRPDRYINYIYGEKEAGGTSWLYLVGRPPEEIALKKVSTESLALRTEKIQHGIFKYGFFPLMTYSILGGFMWFNRNRKHKKNQDESGSDSREVSK